MSVWRLPACVYKYESNDEQVDAIIRATHEILEMWANILQIVTATYLLSRQIGVAFVGPIIVSAVALVATVICGPPSKRFMMAWITKVQERVGKRGVSINGCCRLSLELC
jgi:hypothetical protein